MKKQFLGALALSLALASCGGGTPPTTGAKPAPTPQPAPAPSPIADLPDDATAAREFLFSKRQSRQLAQALSLSPQDTVELGDRLRVVLTVNRAKSGQNIGRKKASAVLIWGNQTVPIKGNVTLGLGLAGESRALKTTAGKVALEVERPNFQDKFTKSTGFVDDTGRMCARFAFDLAAAGQVFSAPAPVEVCEGDTERDAAQVALEKFSKGLPYSYQSAGSAAWTFTRWDGEKALPTPAQFLPLAGLPADALVTVQTLPQFFAPLVTPSAPTERATTIAAQYSTLERQFSAYYRETRVYRVRVSEDREALYVLGLNNWGVSGLHTLRFATSPIPDPRPTLAGARVGSGGNSYGGILYGSVTTDAPIGTEISGSYSARQTATCAAGPSPAYNLPLTPTSYAEAPSGVATTFLSFQDREDVGQDWVYDYRVTLTYKGETRTVTGFTCLASGATEPPPIDYTVRTLDEMTTDQTERFSTFLAFEEYPQETYADLLVFDIPNDATISGTYRIANTPECGGVAGTGPQASGPLALIFEQYQYSAVADFRADVPAGVSDGSGFFWTVTAQHQGKTRTLSGLSCHETLDPATFPPDDGGGPPPPPPPGGID